MRNLFPFPKSKIRNLFLLTSAQCETSSIHPRQAKWLSYADQAGRGIGTANALRHAIIWEFICINKRSPTLGVSACAPLDLQQYAYTKFMTNKITAYKTKSNQALGLRKQKPIKITSMGENMGWGLCMYQGSRHWLSKYSKSQVP